MSVSSSSVTSASKSSQFSMPASSMSSSSLSSTSKPCNCDSTTKLTEAFGKMKIQKLENNKENLVKIDVPLVNTPVKVEASRATSSSTNISQMLNPPLEVHPGFAPQSPQSYLASKEWNFQIIEKIKQELLLFGNEGKKFFMDFIITLEALLLDNTIPEESREAFQNLIHTIDEVVARPFPLLMKRHHFNTHKAPLLIQALGRLNREQLKLLENSLEKQALQQSHVYKILFFKAQIYQQEKDIRSASDNEEIKSYQLRNITYSFILQGMMKEATRVANSISDVRHQSLAFAHLYTNLKAKGKRYVREAGRAAFSAKSAALSIVDAGEKSKYLSQISKSYSDAHLFKEAEEIAHLIPIKEVQGNALEYVKQVALCEQKRHGSCL